MIFAPPDSIFPFELTFTVPAHAFPFPQGTLSSTSPFSSYFLNPNPTLP